MSEFAIVLAIIAAFLVVFPLFWTGIVFLISRIGGWARLAERYAAELPARGETFRMCSGQLNFMGNYRNSLNVTVSSAGIHLQPLYIFSAGHEPLYFPWRDVKDLKENKRLLFTTAKFRVVSDDAGGLTSVSLYRKPVLESLLRHCPVK